VGGEFQIYSDEQIIGEEGDMGKLEGIVRSEIVRLAKKEIRKVSLPLGRDVRSLKGKVSQLRKTVLTLERLAVEQQKELRRGRTELEAPPEEVKKSRFSPRLIQRLRQRLGVTQKEMAKLTGVTVGAIYQWEKGIFEPRGQKKGKLVALRKLGRRDVRRLLEEKTTERAEKKLRKSRVRRTKRTLPRVKPR
jgi:DNA-binding transcriptional regulator YiaG